MKYIAIKLKNLSFRKRTSISLVLFALLLTVIIGLSFMQISSNIILDSSKKLAEKNFSVVYDSLDNYFSDVKNYTTLLIRMDPLQEILKQKDYTDDNSIFTTQLDHYVQQIVNLASSNNNLAFNIVNIYCKNGYVYENLKNAELPFNDYNSCINYFIDNNYITADYMPSTWCDIHTTIDSTEREVFNFLNIRPLYDPATFQEVGVLVTGISEEDLSNYYSDFSDSAYIIHQNGDIVSRTDKSQLGTSYVDNMIYKSITASSDSEGTISMKIDNKVQIITYKRLASNDAYFVVPFDYYNQSIFGMNNSFYKSMILVFISALIVSLIIAMLLSRGLSSSVLTLKKTAQAIQDGDLDARFKSSRNDEIGYLGNTFNEMMDQINNLFEREKDYQKSTKQLELKLMQSQINPHLLYNTLDSIFWALDNKNLIQAKKLIESLSEFFKISLSGGNTLISLEKELNLVFNYITIQKIARNKDITLNINCPADLNSMPFIKLSIQPIVENAIIHGFSGYRDDGHIDITVKSIENDDVEIAIADNGLGITDNNLESIQNVLNSYPTTGITKHFGLYNIQRRITNMFGNEYGISINSELGVKTSVIIKVPNTTDRKDKLKCTM